MAEVVSRVTMGLGVMMALTGVVLGSNPSPTTCAYNMNAEQRKKSGGWTYSESEILGGEDTAEMLLLIDDEDAIGSFSSAELGSVGDGNVVRHGEGGEGTEGGDGALLGSRSGALLLLLLLLLALRRGSFAGEFRLNLLANSLAFALSRGADGEGREERTSSRRDCRLRVSARLPSVNAGEVEERFETE